MLNKLIPACYSVPCWPSLIPVFLVLLRVSAFLANSALKFPRPVTPTVALRLRLPRIMARETRFKSVACALFHFPYPLSPLLATLTKTAGCVPTIPILELATHHSSLPTVLKSFLFIFLRTLLHAQKSQPFCFQVIPHSLRKNTRGVGVSQAGTDRAHP